MPDFYRILEVILYSILSFLPWLLLALYPFFTSLRYNRAVTFLLIIFVTAAQICVGLYVAFFPSSDSGTASLVSTAIYFLFYFLAIRAHFGKLLFTLLMFSNISNFVVVCSKCIEGQLFPLMARQQYRLTFSFTMFIVELFVMIPLFFYIKRIFANAVQKEVSRSVWHYLWLIPATFYLSWFYQLYTKKESGLEIALQPSFVIFLLFINLGAFLIYYIVIRLINEYDKNMYLEKQNHILTLKNLQYANLQEKIAETRRTRHDLRHHITVMQGYLNDGKPEQLKDYLASYSKSLPKDNPIVFCRNDTVNLLLSYFSQQAENNNIAFMVHADLPKKLPIAENDLAVLLGNLLENAIDACSAQNKTERRIIFRGKINGSALFFTIDNTYEGTLKQDKDGMFLSTKHSGPGLGISSARHITALYNGVLRIKPEDGMFYTSVLLHFSTP